MNGILKLILVFLALITAVSLDALFDLWDAWEYSKLESNYNEFELKSYGKTNNQNAAKGYDSKKEVEF